MTLPSLTHIAYLSTKKVPPYLTLCALAEIPAILQIKPIDIPFVGEPTLEVQTTNTANGTQQTVTLTFQTETPLPDKSLAFFVTTPHRHQFIIGNYEQPYPAVTCTQTVTAPSSDASVLTYEILFTAPRAIIPCRTQ